MNSFVYDKLLKPPQSLRITLYKYRRLLGDRIQRNVLRQAAASRQKQSTPTYWYTVSFISITLYCHQRLDLQSGLLRLGYPTEISYWFPISLMLASWPMKLISLRFIVLFKLAINYGSQYAVFCRQMLLPPSKAQTFLSPHSQSGSM